MLSRIINIQHLHLRRHHQYCHVNTLSGMVTTSPSPRRASRTLLLTSGGAAHEPSGSLPGTGGGECRVSASGTGVELRTYCRRDMHVEPLRSLREPSNQMGPLCGRFICIATECSASDSNHHFLSWQWSW